MEEQIVTNEKTNLDIDITSWKEPLEIVSKIILAVVGVCYIAGLFILNFHLRSYGIFYLNFLQIEYVLAGALWLFLCGTTYCVYYEFIVPYIPRPKNWKTKKDKWLGIIKLIFSLFVIYWGSDYVLTILTGMDTSPWKRRNWLIFGVLGLNIYAFTLLIKYIREVIDSHKAKEDKAKKHGRMYYVFYSIAVLFSSISGYAHFVYPKFPPVYGGGMKQKAQLIIKTDQVDTVRHLGISIEDESHSTNVIEVIFEASDYFIISPPEGFDTKNKIKSIRLKKDLIDAAFYLSEK